MKAVQVLQYGGTETLQLAERGEVKTAVGKVLPLSEAVEAQRLMDEGSVKGKIVLSVQ